MLIIIKMNVKELLEKLQLSKGFRNLKKVQQGALKASVLSGNPNVIGGLEKLLNLEVSGRDFDAEIARLLVDEILEKDQTKVVTGFREALSKQQDEQYLEKLMREI